MALTFKNEFNWSNALTALGLLLAGIFAFSAVQSDVRSVTETVARLDATVAKLETRVDDGDSRQRTVEMQRTADLTEIAALRRDITELKGLVRELLPLLRNEVPK